MPEQNTVGDIRIGSLISVSGELGGMHHTNLLCELKGIAFRVDGIRFVVWPLIEERPHLVDPLETDVELVCGPVDETDDDTDEPDDDGEGLDDAPRLALSMWVFAGAVIALVVAEAALGFRATVGLGAVVVGAAALYRRKRGA